MSRPRCLVLGTRDSEDYLRRAGGEIIAKTPGMTCDVLAVCDDAGFPYVETIDLALSTLFRQCDAGHPPHLVLPNHDLIYPKADGYGFTAGAIAFLLEQALARRYPELSLAFDRLGKPEPGLFQLAKSLAGSRRLVMVGDQLETDIRGARAAGIDAVLLRTGVSRWQDAWSTTETGPTHLLPTLAEPSR
jgi:ribonucleotide monophosphatase NagD (HAD superfamily)